MYCIGSPQRWFEIGWGMAIYIFKIKKVRVGKKSVKGSGLDLSFFFTRNITTTQKINQRGSAGQFMWPAGCVDFSTGPHFGWPLSASISARFI